MKLKTKKVKETEAHRSRQNRAWYGDFSIALLLFLVGAFMFLPLLYTVMQALKPLEELFIFPPRFFVRNPTLNNFTLLSVLTEKMWVPFSRYVFNTVFVTLLVTVGNVLFGSMAAYPFAKIDFPGKKALWKMIMIAIVFHGGIAIGFAQFIIMAKIGIIDTYWALVLPQLGGTLGIFLMRQFMVQIHDDMLNAARIDGANEFTIFWRIVMPQVKPAWLTLTIFAFQGTWGQTGNNLIFSETLKMMPTALSQIQAGGIARAGIGFAAALFMMIPPIIIFVVSQTSVINTMTHSGIKE